MEKIQIIYATLLYPYTYIVPLVKNIMAQA